MKILAIDTVSNTATAAVNEDDRLIAQYTSNYNKTHSQKIMPMIDMVLAEAELEVSDIDLFAVSNGPGSFTGVRIGVATINALAHASNKPVVPVNSLESLAYNLCGAEKIVCPIIDARHENVYHAMYEWRGGELACIDKPADGSLAYFLDRIKMYKRKAFFTGDGVFAYKDKITDILGEYAHFAGTAAVLPQASSTASCAWKKYMAGENMTYLQVKPCYLKKSQAERENIERKKNK